MTHLKSQHGHFKKPVPRVRHRPWRWRLLCALFTASIGSATFALGAHSMGQTAIADRADSADGPAVTELGTASQRPDPAPADSAFSPGQYLFGQSAEPNQLGMVYAVFESDEGRITGAFYMPHSSFDCFWGRVEGDRLLLTIRDSYEQTTFSYAVALVQNQVASSGAATAQTGLAGFHQLTALSDSDRRILAVCQAETW